MPRAAQGMLAPGGLLLLLLAAGGQCEDSVAANVGHHTMSRIAAMLSPAECHQLQEQLMGPEEDVKQDLERLSEEKNPIHPRHRRELQDLTRCSEALQNWLGTAGEEVTWGRLARELQRLGRLDIAQELGKNLNQDRILEMQKNVEEYGRSLQHVSSSLLLEGEQQKGTRDRRAPGGELGDLHFERLPPPPYTRSLLVWVVPIAFGITGGFFASILCTVLAVYSCRWALRLDAA